MTLIWRLLSAEPTLEVQICLAILHAIAWQLAVRRLAVRVISPWINRQSWAPVYKRRSHDTLTNGYGVHFKDEADAFKFSSLFAAFVAIHLVGGALCIPSLLIGQTPFTMALAAQGALIECGWEASDLAVRVWQLCGFEGQAGRDINPPMLVFFAVCHHLMGTSAPSSSRPPHVSTPFVARGVARLSPFNISRISYDVRPGYTSRRRSVLA